MLKAYQKLQEKNDLNNALALSHIGGTKDGDQIASPQYDGCPSFGPGQTQQYEEVQSDYYYPIRRQKLKLMPNSTTPVEVCAMDCLDPAQFRAYKPSPTYSDFFLTEAHPLRKQIGSAAKLVNNGMLNSTATTINDSDEHKDRCRWNYL